MYYSMYYYKIDELAKKVGGPLRLTALILNRARQVVKKAPRYVKSDVEDPVHIAFLEMMEGKVQLSDTSAPFLQKPEPDRSAP